MEYTVITLDMVYNGDVEIDGSNQEDIDVTELFDRENYDSGNGAMLFEHEDALGLMQTSYEGDGYVLDRYEDNLGRLWDFRYWQYNETYVLTLAE